MRLGGDRFQFDPEAAAVAGCGLEADFAAHAVHDLADQGETDTRPLVALAELLKHLPDLVVVLLFDADAFVLEPDPDPMVEA